MIKVIHEKKGKQVFPSQNRNTFWLLVAPLPRQTTKTLRVARMFGSSCKSARCWAAQHMHNAGTMRTCPVRSRDNAEQMTLVCPIEASDGAGRDQPFGCVVSCAISKPCALNVTVGQNCYASKRATDAAFCAFRSANKSVEFLRKTVHPVRRHTTTPCASIVQ